ncbi:MAG: hypothetical protein HC921_06365 [Synechococcaceae cyanobacterium SM2_3_1]|nr:hypothetical protein [Synechococcaceae cyanobacterium SM2_3_1]
MGKSHVKSGVTHRDWSMLLGWLALTLAASGTGCFPVRDLAPPQPTPPIVNTHHAPDGTQFLTAQQSLAALTAEFPDYLLYPDAAVVSSGKIEDHVGGVLSALIRTHASQQEVLDYYQKTLWFSRWELLTRLDQEDVVILTFEENSGDAATSALLRQVVIQLGSAAKAEERDILILLSWVEGSQGFPDQTLEMLTFSQWLLGADHQAWVQLLSTLHSAKTKTRSSSDS